MGLQAINLEAVLPRRTIMKESGVFRVGIVVSLLICVGLVAGCGKHEKVDVAGVPRQGEAWTRPATLMFNRESCFVACGVSQDVFLNAQKVGSIGNGGRLTVTFTPRRGNNNLYIVWEGLIGERSESKTQLFE